MPDFPTAVPDIPDSTVAETLFTMHNNLGHVPATNRILLNLRTLAGKLGIGATTPSGPGVLRQSGVAGTTAWGLLQNADITDQTITPAKVNAGGTANRVVRTTDGANALWGQVLAADITDKTITPVKLNAGGTANRILVTTDGATAAWSTLVDAMVAANALTIGKINGGGTANRLALTTDGINATWGMLADAMVGVNAISASKIFAGGTANRVLRTTDGTNALWQQVITADIANNAITAPLLGAGAVGQIGGAVSTTQTYGGATPATIPGTLVNWTSLNKPILVVATLRDLSATASTGLVVNVYDGATPSIFMINETVAAGSQRTITAIAYVAAPGAGAHAYSLYWSMSAPQVTATAASLAIVELH